MISSFDQKPANGGMPIRARVAMAKHPNVTGMYFRRPPISLILLEWTAWISEPAPRKSKALKNAWVNRWNRLTLWPAFPSPSAAIM